MNQHQKPMKQDLLLSMPASGTPRRAPVTQGTTRIIAPAPVVARRIHRNWPLTTVVIGLGLTAVWVSLLGYFLGYALVALVGWAI